MTAASFLAAAERLCMKELVAENNLVEEPGLNDGKSSRKSDRVAHSVGKFSWNVWRSLKWKIL